MSLMHYVPGTYFTTDEFRFLIEITKQKIEALKVNASKEQIEFLDKNYNTLYQKLFSLTDHD